MFAFKKACKITAFFAYLQIFSYLCSENLSFMPEIILHYIWEHCLWAGFEQYTTDGKKVEILSVGGNTTGMQDRITAMRGFG